MNNYQMCIEELAMNNSIGLSRCSKSTVYRWAREINKILENWKYDWRVKADVKDPNNYSIYVEEIYK